MRQRCDRQGIERFLQSLGTRFTKPGRLYLVGGTTMVYEGLRQQTLDITISFEVDDRDRSAFVEALRVLQERLSLNIEEASPADFIPLPAGYRERSPFLGRYGQLEVFHFDLYSTALSKIERGTEGDLDDVLSLLRNGRIEFAVLAGYFEEIMISYATESIKQDPVEYQRKFDILTDMWLTGSSLA